MKKKVTHRIQDCQYIYMTISYFYLKCINILYYSVIERRMPQLHRIKMIRFYGRHMLGLTIWEGTQYSYKGNIKLKLKCVTPAQPLE